jgi:hypothetical protein
MITRVKNKKDLKSFVYFIKDLYKGETHYIYPVFYILLRELKKRVLVDKTYKAILCYKDNQIVGRLLYTFEFNEKTKKDVCYFSYFDFINNQDVFNELLEYMENDMINANIGYSEGCFTPYDPDNRRGVLVKGFDDDPVIFTSYNYPYYQDLYENYGFKKAHDTFSLQPEASEENYKKLHLLAQFFERRFDVLFSPINLKNMDQEINDIHQILIEATTEDIYQEAPSIDLIKQVAENLKLFLNPEIIIIAREKDTLKPIGFVFCLLDYNQIFKLTKGKINIFKLLRPLKYINRSRGMMQYVVPKYQSSGLIGYMYYGIFNAYKRLGITDFEAGTMMESNPKSFKAFSKFGGEVKKIYRIYGKEITK